MTVWFLITSSFMTNSVRVSPFLFPVTHYNKIVNTNMEYMYMVSDVTALLLEKKPQEQVLRKI